MYWVVLAGVLSVEFITYPVLRFIPFYGFFRLGGLLWLVLPQTQGAVQVYETHIAPWLARHNDEFEQLLNRAHMCLENSSLGWLLRLYSDQEPAPNSQAQKENTAVESLIGGFRIPVSYQNFFSSLSSTNRDKLMEAVSGTQQSTLDSLFSILSQLRRSDPENPNDGSNASPVSPDKEGFDVVESVVATEAETTGTQQPSARRRWW